jgi:hypothetical protein
MVFKTLSEAEKFATRSVRVAEQERLITIQILGLQLDADTQL